MSYRLVLTTVSSLREAKRLSRMLLEKRLAACVNISAPVESHYWWKDKKERAREVMLFIKTRATLFSKLEKVIRRSHSYAVPEIIEIPILKGNRAYLNWIKKETA